MKTETSGSIGTIDMAAILQQLNEHHRQMDERVSREIEMKIRSEESERIKSEVEPKIETVRVEQKQGIEGMREEMRMRFDLVDKRFEANDKRFDAVDKELESLKSGNRWLIGFMTTIIGLILAILTILLNNG